MQITNLEELLQAIGAKKVFKADGTLTKQAFDAYDELVLILEFLYEQGVVVNRDVIDKLDSWSSDVVENQY